MSNSQFLSQSISFFQHSFHLSPSRYNFPIKCPVNVTGYQRFTNTHSPYNTITTYPKTKTKCFILNHHNSEREKRVDKNEVIWRSIENVLKASVLLGFLFVYDDGRLAMAASGGRMGGRSSSRSSGSRSTSSRSYRIPSSYSSRSYSTWDSSPDSSSESYSTQISGPSVWPKSPTEDESVNFVILVICLVLYFKIYDYDDNKQKQRDVKTSVLMLQVGLLGTAKSLQADLNRIAKEADTSTPKGLSYILQESTLALLRHPDYCISGYSSVDVKKSEFEGEQRFNNLSIEERGKFDEETLVNVNNIKKQSVASRGSNDVCSEYIVVTIIVAARGMIELAPIKNSAQLKEALQKLASISSSKILAAEVLWTPQEENDSLTEEKMLEDYPQLHPL